MIEFVAVSIPFDYDRAAMAISPAIFDAAGASLVIGTALCSIESQAISTITFLESFVLNFTTRSSLAPPLGLLGRAVLPLLSLQGLHLFLELLSLSSHLTVGLVRVAA